MKKTPTSVRKVVLILVDALTTKCKQDIKNCEDEDLISYHHNLGQHIRNEYGLWKGNIPLLKDCLRIQKIKYNSDYKWSKDYYKKNNVKVKIIHPDDASMIILRELKRRLSKC